MNTSAWTPWIDGLLEAVWVLDPASLRIVAANAAAASLQGVELEDLLDAHAPDLGASLQDEVFWHEVSQDPERHPRHETQLRHGSGTPVLVERLVSPMTLPDGVHVLLVAMRDKSEQQRSQRQLEELLAELRATLESTADGLLVCNLDGKIRAFNRLFAQLWDLPAELQTHDDDAAVYAFLSQAVQNHAQYQQRLAQIQRSPLLEATDVVVLRSGRVLECITRPQLARGRPIGRVYAFRDITERAATEAQLQLAAKVFESSLDAIFVTDPQHRILVCNPMAEQLTQFSQAAMPGCLASDLFYSRQHADWLSELEPKLAESGFWEGELWHRREDGSSVALQVAWVVLRGAKGKVLNTVVFAKDLTDRIAAQQRIEQLAYSDPLTQLPNRLLLTERVDYAIRMSERSGKGFAVLFLDLDRFKTINDSLGHLFGDMVLLEVARRLKGCLRQTDTLCRLGGDEFVIHLHEADQHAAELTAQRILNALEQPIRIEDMSFSLTCSAGIALYPADGASLNELIQHADTAMYQVKERGKGHYRFYRPQMNTDLLGRIKLDHALREGLQRGEFVLHYQPRVNLGTDQAPACEALIRWNHPEQGLVFPGAFIGVAEETGLIVSLGDWVLREAVRQAASWAREGMPCQVAVNVSALQFQQATFVDEVAACLREHGLPPTLLELELTESILIHDAEESMERLQALANMGVNLSLDDFGTGYSSLAYLKRFPLDKLKIDRTFIQSMHENERDAAIVSAIVQMGHALKLKVVAEGVEHPEQQALLERWGCDQYQGFLFSRALPVDDFTAHLARGLPVQTR